MFHSFVGQELRARLRTRFARREARLRILRRELESGVKHQPGANPNSPHTAQVRLTSTEVAHRRQELEQLVRASLGRRALIYFLTCAGCQTFWTTLAAWSLLVGEDWLNAVATACAYAFVARYVGLTPVAPQSGKPSATNCPTCGRRAG